MRANVLAIVLLLGSAGTARADAVMPPPEDCPVGSEGVRCHGPRRCAPRTCSGDSDCNGGRCVELALCVSTHSCSGPRREPQLDHVEGPCGADDACDSERGATCRRVSVCTGGAPESAAAAEEPGAEDAQEEEGACAASAGSSRSSGAPWLLALIASALILGRRRS